jgi:hypothetical protein
MTLWHWIVLPMPWLAPAVPDYVKEPDYQVIQSGDRWIVQKPRVGTRQPLPISHHLDRSAAEFRKRSLPLLRLNGLFVRFDPATYARTLIADWTDQEDAQQIGFDVRDIVSQFAPTPSKMLLESTPLYLARLPGATGYTAEDGSDSARFAIYVDPFRATSRLHLAATIVHELTHVERYRARGFHVNRAAAVLPKEDFVLLGLFDEFAAYQAEAALVRSFLARQTHEEARRSTADALRAPELNWPQALTVMLGIEGTVAESRRIMEARHHVGLDLKPKASIYWESRHLEQINPTLQRTIRDWYKRSPEWRQISAERPTWKKAGK